MVSDELQTIGHKHGPYTFVLAVVLEIVMAVPALAVAPRRGGNPCRPRRDIRYSYIYRGREQEVRDPRDLSSLFPRYVPSSRAGYSITDIGPTAIRSCVAPTGSPIQEPP